MGRAAISVLQAHHLLQGAREKGLDLGAILSRADVPANLFEPDAQPLSSRQMAALMRVLSRQMGDEAWGLCSRPVPLGTFAQAARLMVRCKTLGNALRVATRAYHAALVDFTPRLQVTGGVARLRLVDLTPWRQKRGYAHSSFLFLGYNLMCWLTARRLPLHGLALRRGRIAAETMRDTSWLFEAGVQFDAAESMLSFDADLLDLPVMKDAEALEAQLASGPIWLLRKFRDRASNAERVRQLLARHMADGMLSLEDTASLLAMAPQTLRKKLYDEGVGFQTLKDGVRCDLAIEYLVRPDLTLVDVGARVGFADASTFSRAFKGWTGVTPGMFRQDPAALSQMATPRFARA